MGIEGLSRYGKAAIVTEAFDQRVAVGLIGSSGEGGVKLHRHIFGEAVENLAGGEYYWMAGNFMKYGASDPPMTAADLPVDSHELIALCAPRPCFISYGTVERGDPKWVDAHGSFMAAVLAGPVYRLLGKKDLGTPGNYLTDPMPPVNKLIGGELAWRQHNGVQADLHRVCDAELHGTGGEPRGPIRAAQGDHAASLSLQAQERPIRGQAAASVCFPMYYMA